MKCLVILIHVCPSVCLSVCWNELWNDESDKYFYFSRNLSLQELRHDIEICSSQIRELHSSTRKKLSDLNQTLPPDTGEKLANVELIAEKTLTDLEDKESEHKTAKNVRYEFQARNTF